MQLNVHNIRTNNITSLITVALLFPFRIFPVLRFPVGLPHFKVLRFPARTFGHTKLQISVLHFAVLAPDIWSRIFPACIFRSCILAPPSHVETPLVSHCEVYLFPASLRVGESASVKTRCIPCRPSRRYFSFISPELLRLRLCSVYSRHL